jgi:hypothetical protein
MEWVERRAAACGGTYAARAAAVKEGVTTRSQDTPHRSVSGQPVPARALYSTGSMTVRRLAFVCALCLVATLPPAHRSASAQLIPGQRLDPSSQYEDAVGVPLSDIVRGFAYNKKAVITQGVLDMMDTSLQYYRLRDEGAAALIVPVYGAHDDVRRLVGREVEVTGLVREVPHHQECCVKVPRCILDSECEDPSLPPLPSLEEQGRNHWPHVSVTIWAITDLTPPPGAERKREYRGVSLESLVMNPGERDGLTLRVVGQFRGKNLYGDLPSRSQRQSSDWVIKDDAFAAWVSGKPPRGPGWQLDPDLKRDTGRWVEVVGRVDTRNGITYLRAVQVALASAPAAAVRHDAPPPPRPTSPPVVVFALPTDGDAEVPADARFVIQFSKDMDERSFANRVVLRYAGPAMPGDRVFDGLTLAYDADRRALTVDPRDVLRRGRAVELLLLPGILDVDGLALTPRADGGAETAGAATDVLRYVIGE